ncbi:hypothetical protein [Streptomyces sp. NPDC052494]|uniref:hypothetical protein n=1 Tax=Streptomyces sp. NPDC052494 TaxID=3365692 RepID=UPI0037D62684
MADSSKPASAATAAANREALSRYAMEDRQDFADRDRGFLAPLPDKLYAGGCRRTVVRRPAGRG